ncbi:16S rRNA (cytosine(1402)-N(4))-methyltransferase RsmH [Granulicella paludicola]|uniref:16S rRNA (cytosine(1402)-N(4))-methyltransferase RsmH n=1 Tax=Granulicella paludicola TaxID=474951 RepID=UPI0021E0843A|nr:16S rRNA (cytosine(1402)-N(4))-methyltransferase RsmH [Granulicella paludicola]
MAEPQHVPVLLEESLEYLNVRRGGVVCDATLGFAGHSSAIARRLGPQGKLIAFDRDEQAMAKAKVRLAELAEELGGEMPTVEFVPRPFSDIAEVLKPESLDGLLADFGVSSMQLDQAHRGFSFRADGPLDMRMDPRSELTAEQVVNQVDEEDLANLIYEYGEERRSRRIARAIVRARPVTTTAELARIVSACAPPIKGEKIHPATRTFQALRIRVNDELGEIQSLLKSAESLLKPGGRVVLISFHSLEDRLVKDKFKEAAADGRLDVLTRKPVVATEQESLRNPRSRSAKLRAAEKLEVKQGKVSSSQQRTSNKYRRR